MKHRKLYFAFIDLEKAFDRVPRTITWWAMRKLGVQEWVIDIVKAMYEKAKCSVRVNGSISEMFNVQVGVHQGSVLSPLLFIMVMEALSRDFKTGCPWELLYADDLAIIAESMEELVVKLTSWKESIEAKGLKVNTLKTKIMCSSFDATKPSSKSGKYPCGVCHKGVGQNSIFCKFCKHWIHKKCSGLVKLTSDVNFRWKRCMGQVPELPITPIDTIYVGA